VATFSLDFGEIYTIYLGYLSAYIYCFKFWTFRFISEGFIDKKQRCGKFTLNFRNSLVPKQLVGSEKIWGCKNDTNILYLQAKFGDPPQHGDGRQEVRSFLYVCLSHLDTNLNAGLRCSRSKSYIVAVYWSTLMQFQFYKRKCTFKPCINVELCHWRHKCH